MHTNRVEANLWSAQAVLALFPSPATLRTPSMASSSESGSMAPALQSSIPHTCLPSVLVTILVLACCLVLGGFPSPAAAHHIVVTPLTDTADPPFNADGVCGTGTISNLPGADGLISLREAIIAANNTAGADTITFDPSLSGGTIVINFDDLDGDATPDPLPALCGGQTRIDGDLNGDGVPDITLEGGALPVAAPPVAAAGLLILSSHNTITGLRLQHFPTGIRVRAGDFTTPGIVEHTRVTNNIVADSKIDGLFVATGNVPGSRVAHTTLTQNLVMNNARFGVLVAANLPGAVSGSDTQIDHTTITDNEVTGNRVYGLYLLSVGDNNVLSDTTIARNTVTGNAFFGINVNGGFNGADNNTLDVDIKDNTVTDNGLAGIRVVAGQDNSSHNHTEALIRGNTVERHQSYGIGTFAAQGVALFPTGISNHNVLDVRIEQNTVKEQAGGGITVCGGLGSPDGRTGAVADNNQVSAIVKHNTVEGNANRGIELCAGGPGTANSNSVEAWVTHNTVCNNGTDIIGEGGYTGSILVPTPNMGTGNVLTGAIFQNTATTVTVADGTPGNTATVTQFKNDACP